MNQNQTNGVRVAAIEGSVRSGNFTSKALALVVDEFRKNDITIDLVQPASMNLSLPGVGGDAKDSDKIKEIVEQATGVILSTPEYHGSYSSVIKLVIENLGFPSSLKGKPVAMLGVAAGQIGAIKALEHLSSVCTHIGALVLPGAVSVARVQQVFDAEGRCLDEKIEKRIRSVATNLLDYIKGFICPKVYLEQMVREEEAAA